MTVNIDNDVSKLDTRAHEPAAGRRRGRGRRLLLAAHALPLSAEAAVELSHALKAIADPTRLRLLSLIQAHDDGEACVCDLTAPIGLTQPTVSHHLKVLLDAGLVTRSRRGTWAYYRAVPERLAALAAVISTPQLV